MLSDRMELDFEKVLESDAYDRASAALFDVVRAAFVAGASSREREYSERKLEIIEFTPPHTEGD